MAEILPANSTFAPLRAFVDELARCGVEHAVTSPGSRNAPLLLTLAADSRIRAHSALDERSAGYVAVGLARSTGRPVALTCTSGTAAANLLPAVVEAHQAGLPLLVLTADRPPELRDVGAGQSIDQIKLYGSAAKWFVEVGNHAPGRETAVHYRALACRAFHSALSGRPGPVHLNFGLREPLAPVTEDLDPSDWHGRPGGEPWTRVASARGGDGDAGAAFARRERAVSRGVIVCGQIRDRVADQAAALGRAAGWPVLADALSGVRCGPHDRSQVIAHYDPLLRSDAFAERMRPDLVVRIGDMPTSKALRRWIAGSRQVVLDPDGAWNEPTRTAADIITADPAGFAAAAAQAEWQRDADWAEGWRAANARVGKVLEAAPDLFEAKLYAGLADALGDGDDVWVSSSMPVRDVEAYFPAIQAKVRFLANRGANGIDGVTSSAAGAALAATGRTYLLIGELALLHDLGGLVSARRLGAMPTIVCVNNGGGGIFDFLPVATSAPRDLYEQHIATPVEVDLRDVARIAGLPHRLALTPDELRDAVAEPALVEIPIERGRSLELHRQVQAEVASAISAEA